MSPPLARNQAEAAGGRAEKLVEKLVGKTAGENRTAVVCVTLEVCLPCEPLNVLAISPLCPADTMPMPAPAPTTYAYFTCQPGAENPLKEELAARQPTWRLAFSRPGFVSFKCPGVKPGAIASGALPVFARTQAVSIGRVDCATLDEAANAVWQLPGVTELLRHREVRGLHVWQRDAQLPGDDDFEPGITLLAEEARQALLQAAYPEPTESSTESSAESSEQETEQSEEPVKNLISENLKLAKSEVAPQGAIVLDVVMVEPGEWYVGWHRAESRAERWPGAMLPIAAPENVVSRAYLKMEEALKWSAIPAKRGDLWVELGCSPGGASQALLDRGFRVIGVDPAEVEEPVASHPNFRHLCKRTTELRRTELLETRWLAADLNATPQYTLNAVEEIVTNPNISMRGIVLTLKLTSWNLALPELLLGYIKRVQSWGFRDVRLRQLVHNRREICLIALPSRGQRRMSRGRKQRKKPSKGSQTSNAPQSASDLRFDAPRELVSRHHFR